MNLKLEAWSGQVFELDLSFVQQEIMRNECTYKEPGGFLFESDLELAALRASRFGPLAIEGVALVDPLQLVLEQRDLVVQPPASLRIKTAARAHLNLIPSQRHEC
jgi:hypothetical protein